MKKLKILIAEDDKSMQALYDVSLSEEYFDKRMAGNGLEAVRQYASWKPDIVILDILMPKMLGYSVLREIRKLFGDHFTTIIMATSVASEGDIAFCKKEGIQGYIVKPFDTKMLTDIILGYHNKANKERRGKH